MHSDEAVAHAVSLQVRSGEGDDGRQHGRYAANGRPVGHEEARVNAHGTLFQNNAAAGLGDEKEEK
jgi:hypothetical protein